MRTLDWVYGQGDGFLWQNGRPAFPIGFYEFPKDDAPLAAMAAAGVNLVRCGNRDQLDRVQALGMMGWVPLSLHAGPTDALKQRVESMMDHPTLAVWEGPDEIVWNFTAWSHLWRKDKLAVFEQPGEWWMQTPRVVAYSEDRAREVIPNMQQAIRWIRSVDPLNRQVWVNEARDSDLMFVRQYLDDIDITGCDDYPVSADSRDVGRLSDSTDRWKQIGRGRPVWMVLQGFAWSDLEGESQETAYPSFEESRLMAYACITHGARGVLYWGSSYLKSPGHEALRKSLYALTSELAALQSFLTAPEEHYIQARIIEGRRQSDAIRADVNVSATQRGVSKAARRCGRDWLIVLANKDDTTQMGVEVSGLADLDGMAFHLLYGKECVTIHRGEFVTRLKPHEVKLFATSRRWETEPNPARDFAPATE